MDSSLTVSRTWLVVRPPAEIDLLSAGVLRQELSAAVARSRSVAVDMSDVAFMNSVGVGVLIAAQHRLASQGGQLVVRNASAALVRLLRVAGASSLLETDPAAAEPADTAPTQPVSA